MAANAEGETRLHSFKQPVRLAVYGTYSYCERASRISKTSDKHLQAAAGTACLHSSVWLASKVWCMGWGVQALLLSVARQRRPVRQPAQDGGCRWRRVCARVLGVCAGMQLLGQRGRERRKQQVCCQQLMLHLLTAEGTFAGSLRALLRLCARHVLIQLMHEPLLGLVMGCLVLSCCRCCCLWS